MHCSENHFNMNSHKANFKPLDELSQGGHSNRIPVPSLPNFLLHNE